MSFNTALSGLKAADADLRVTGNNIANASTTGFKESRAEFGDVYAVSVLGSGSNAIGSGVLLANVAQQFSQGTITFTDRSLDLAVNGNGFFILSEGASEGGQTGARSYTRAGAFGLDANGFIVANNGARLQGFGATDQGLVIQGVPQDIQIQTTTQEPSQTTAIDQSFNVNASASVLLERGNTTFSNNPVTIGIARFGLDNGYNPGTIDIDGLPYTFSSGANATAEAMAAELNGQNNMSATAVTSAQFVLTSALPTGNGDILVNGVPINAAITFDELANNITANTSNDIIAENVAGVITITHNDGADISIDISSNLATTGRLQGMVFQGSSTANINGPDIVLSSVNPRAVVGGELLITLNDTTTLDSPTGNIFTAPIPTTPFINNEFDPTDQETFNHSTSMTTYDSLGNPHITTQYFVKEPPVSDSGVAQPNTWTLYVQIDGENVGDPLPNDPTLAPTEARFNMTFNDDGSLNESATDDVVITNWTPLDENGNWNGALRPENASPGVDLLPLPDPPTSSNFFVDVSGSTQFGTDFAVTNLSQDGFAAGQLTRIEISDTGIVQARFTNGQTQVLGQVILASFTNQQGLSPLGDTAWAESFESGGPIVGLAQTGNLGAVQSGALEDSNVDLSAELVNLIIAQRNYQANAKTIETANAVTQTIINLR